MMVDSENSGGEIRQSDHSLLLRAAVPGERCQRILKICESSIYRQGKVGCVFVVVDADCSDCSEISDRTSHCTLILLNIPAVYWNR